VISCAKEVLTGTNWTGKTFLLQVQGLQQSRWDLRVGREASINLSMLDADADAAVIQVAVLVAMCDLSKAFGGTSTDSQGKICTRALID